MLGNAQKCPMVPIVGTMHGHHVRIRQMILPHWIFGAAIDGNEYVTHTQFPRFVARISEEDDAPIFGLTIALNSGEVLSDIHWIDEPNRMDPAYLLAVADACARALEEYSDSLPDHEE